VYGIRAGKPLFLSWKVLKGQFGRSYVSMYPFQQDFRAAVAHIRKEVYHGLRFAEVTGGWSLGHSPLAVQPRYFRGYVQERQLSLLPPEPDEPEETHEGSAGKVVTHNGERRVIASTLVLKDIVL
jgi:hypothetical protein